MTFLYLTKKKLLENHIVVFVNIKKSIQKMLRYLTHKLKTQSINEENSNEKVSRRKTFSIKSLKVSKKATRKTHQKISLFPS